MVKPNQFLRNVLLFIFLFFIVFDGYPRDQQDDLKKLITFIQQKNNSPEKTQEVLTDLWPVITVSKSVLPGGNYTCTIKLTNQGSVTISNILIVFYAPNAKNRLINPLFDKLHTTLISVVSQPPLPYTTEGDPEFPGKIKTVTWPNLTLISGASLEITITLSVEKTIESNTILSNDFFIYENNTPVLITTAITEIELAPDLVFSKSITGDKIVKIGDIVEFELRVTNQGKKNTDKFEITDVLDSRFEFIEFVLPQTADEQTSDPPPLKWIFNNLQKQETKIVKFKVRIKEFKTTQSFTEIINSAELKRGNVETEIAQASISVRSDPDLTPKFSSIPEPKSWKLTDGIEIELNSQIFNIGGSPFKETFTVKFWYYYHATPFASQLCTDPISDPPEKTWEVVVSPNIEIPSNMNINTDDGFPVETQKIMLLHGGYYRYFIEIDPQHQLTEKDITNNITCIDNTIHVPLQFFLSKNVFKPNESPEPLGLDVQVPAGSRVKVNLYNVAGELIKKHQDIFFELEGIYKLIPWDGKDKNGNLVASGVYTFGLETQNQSITRKVIVVR